jgi:MFS family permease
LNVAHEARKPNDRRPAGWRSAPLGETWHAWLALAIGVLAVSAHSAFAMGIAVLMKAMLSELGWTRSQYAVAMNFRLAIMVATIPFAGQLADRIGARSVLAAGAFAMGAGIAGLAAVHSLPELYALGVITGPGQACIGSVAGSVLVLRMFRHRRGLAIGILNGGDNLINSAVPLVAASFLLRFGWRVAIASLGAAYLGLGVLTLGVLRGTDRAGSPQAGKGEPHRQARLRDLPWGNRQLWLLLTAYTLIYAFITSLGIHFQAYQTDLGRSVDEAARIYSVNILIGAIGAPIFGWLAERVSARAALSVVVAGLATTSVLVWTTTDLRWLMGWALAYGIVNSGAVALLALVLSELFGARQIGSLMGVAMVFCMGGTILGNYFSASVFDHTGSYVPAWETYTALMAVTLIPVELLRRAPVLRASFDPEDEI